MDEDPVWLIRAGRNGEAEPACLELGICGVGWPSLPDLSGMSSEELAEEIENAYPGAPNGRIRSYRRQLRDFIRIEAGDLVVLPRKPDRHLTAVGRVTGHYEHRPELGEYLNHVRQVEWLTDSFPRENFERVMGSLNQPITIGRLRVDAGTLEEALSTDQPL